MDAKKTAAAERQIERTTAKPPVFEHVETSATESFLWRLDDYPWERNVWNFHPECEIHLIRYASGVALTGDHIGHFEPGYLAVVGGGLPHDWVTKVEPGELLPGRDIVLQFDPERLTRAAKELPELNLVEQLLYRARRGLAFRGEARRRGAEILETMGKTEGLARLALFFELLHTLSLSDEYEILSSESFAPNLDKQTLDIVHRALSYALANFNRDVKITELCEMFGMSETAFSRFFKKNSGNTFTDHITKLRIGEACKLLAGSKTPITEICFEVGYANLSNFNRNFRNQRGMTPAEYRRLAEARRGRR
ncbi:AraC family transcriptional regulator [Methylocapsa sp. S129]|uniref:AraC family transcriptional regulator n=1 Tax=Methylocapsa sp. S129 TaxID=1641869 RepID=UPI00131E3419|nr:AraC family transcriptional regulator [Methylocapsa sp. S129]